MEVLSITGNFYRILTKYAKNFLIFKEMLNKSSELMVNQNCSLTKSLPRTQKFLKESSLDHFDLNHRRKKGPKEFNWRFFV